jgi:translocation and assembly module TamB
VSRRLAYGFIAAVALGAVTLAAAGLWLLATPSGARWLLGTAAGRAGVRLELERVEGSLAGTLSLSGARLGWTGGEARLHRLRLRWRPAGLLRGRLEVAELVAEDGEILLAQAAAAPSAGPSAFAWPHLSGWPLRLRGEVAALRVERVAFLRPEGETGRLDRLEARLRWAEGILDLDGLELLSSAGRLSGQAAAGFVEPALRLKLRAEPAAPAGGIDALLLELRLEGTAERGGLAGPLLLEAQAAGETTLWLTGGVELSGAQTALHAFVLTRPGRRGTLRGEASLDLAGAGRLELRATAEAVDLAAETGVATDLGGTVEMAGTLDDYRGRFDLANRGAGWRQARLAGRIAGGREALRLEELAGDWLRGSVRGEATVGWAKGLRVAGTVQGRGFDPAVLDPGWSGRVNLDLEGELALAEGEPLSASLHARLRESRLRGRPLTGRADLEARGEDLRIAALELHGDGFDLSAGGRLRERLEVAADVRDLGGLAPGGRGRLRLHGWLSWRDGDVAGELGGEGRDLALDGLEVAAIEVAAEHRVAGGPFSLRLVATRPAWKQARLEALELTAAGLPQRHELSLAARWAQGEAELAAAGGWRNRLWTGRVSRLAGRSERTGAWRLAEPVALQAGPGRLLLAPLRLEGGGGEELELSADLLRPPWLGTVAARWQRLDLALANPWLGEARLTGRTSGEAHLRFEPGVGSTLLGEIEADGALTHDGERLEVRRATAAVAWSERGLEGHIDLMLVGGGRLTGEIRSAEPFRLALPDSGEAQADWQQIDLGLLSPWLADLTLAGATSGNGRLAWDREGRLKLAAEAQASGRLTREGTAIAARQVEVKVDWGARGLQATLAVELEEGGRLRAEARSAEPAHLAIPGRGEVSARWEDIPLERARPWLAPTLRLEGKLAGEAQGEWLPAGRFALAGHVVVSAGRLTWLREDGEMTVALRAAEADWEWRGESLQGRVDLTLAEAGQAGGTFRLPLPARWPINPVPEGPVAVRLEGRLREQGMLAAVFPGLLRETQGELQGTLTVGGTWRQPALGGQADLSGAGAYLPAAGIQLAQVTARIELAGETVRLASFAARSGPGRLEGEAEVRLTGWKPSGYRGALRGERFEAVRLPELRLLVSPDLTFEGTPERLAVRGRVTIPELQARGRERPAMVHESPDVVVAGAKAAPERQLPMALDLQIKVVLGDKVQVRAAGVDARLEGEVDLVARGLREMTARGEIEIVEGSYAAYGARLKIVRGKLLFAGGPIDQPTLDILALRTAGEVKAGVQVGGTPRAPVVKLTSEPAMPDTDILAYIVLGRPLGSDPGQAGLLMAAAGALLSRGESAVLQDRIKRRLGVDVLEVESGGADVTQSMLTVGKYLSPRLFISYGQSFFGGPGQARLRYEVGRQWELESKFGVESGVDLYYKIEFK